MRKKSDPNRAYIIVVPINGANDVEAHLIHWDGRHLGSAVARAAFYAFEAVWLSKPDVRQRHGHLKVDPHAYTLDQFMQRHGDTWKRMRTNGLFL